MYRVEKDTPAARPVMKEIPMPSPPSTSPLRWSRPAGWTELPAGGMRKAIFRTGPEGAEVSVVALGGAAGGLLSNVNRWRGQIGLDPIDEAGLSDLSEKIRSPAGELVLVDFTGKGPSPRSRIAAAVLNLGATTWFFKMMGGEEEVGKAKPAFRKFLGGLRAAR